MNKCLECIHKNVCSILVKADRFSARINGATMGITECDHYIYDAGFEKNETTNHSTTNILEKLGLDNSPSMIPANAPTTSNIVLNGIMCPCCNNLLAQDKFEGEICNECGQEVCVDCAITTADDIILCEKCF